MAENLFAKYNCDMTPGPTGMPAVFSQDGYDKLAQHFGAIKSSLKAPEDSDAKAKVDALKAEWAQVELPDNLIEAHNTFMSDIVGPAIDADERTLSGIYTLLTVAAREVSEMLKYRLSLHATPTRTQPLGTPEDLTNLKNLGQQIADMLCAMGLPFEPAPKESWDKRLGRGANRSVSPSFTGRNMLTSKRRYSIDDASEQYTPVMLAKALGRPWTFATLLDEVRKQGRDFAEGWDNFVEDEEGNPTEEREHITLPTGQRLYCHTI